MAVILITGAAGRIGSMLRPRLARPDRTLRLLDSVQVEPGSGEEAIQASATDLEAMTKACQGADAVIHLAAQAGEAPWGRILKVNIHGGSLYYHRYGMDAICIRILTCSERPYDARMLSTWLSPDDAGRLFEACLTTPSPGFRVIYGVSANTRGGWVSLDEARALGYEPRDDAEVYAEEVLATYGEAEPGDPLFDYLGGEFTSHSLDVGYPT